MPYYNTQGYLCAGFLDALMSLCTLRAYVDCTGDMDFQWNLKGRGCVMFSIQPMPCSVLLSGLRAYPCRKKLGTDFMTWFCALADKHGIDLVLEPYSAHDSLSQEKLVLWYKSFDFKQDSVTEFRLRRTPKPLPVDKL